MAQMGNVLVIKADNLSLIPGFHREGDSWKWPSDFYMHTKAYTHKLACKSNLEQSSFPVALFFMTDKLVIWLVSCYDSKGKVIPYRQVGGGDVFLFSVPPLS